MSYPKDQIKQGGTPGQLSPTPGASMGWFHFLTGVGLYLMAMAFLGYGIIQMVEDSLWMAEETQKIYAMAPQLKAVKGTAGVVAMAIAALALVVQRWLKRYKRRGILGLYALFFSAAAYNVCYCLKVVTVSAKDEMLFLKHSQEIENVVDGGALTILAMLFILLLVINIAYFSHRWHLFGAHIPAGGNHIRE